MQEQIVLHRALIRSASSTEAIRLIEEGADVNALDDQGRTPLHVAAEMGQDKVIPSMLEAGADPAKVDLNGRSAFRVAVEGSSRPNTRWWSQRQINGCRKIAKLLKSQSLKRDEDRLIAILFDDNAAELQKLLDAGLDCESRIPGTIGAIFGGNPEMQAILGALGREINRSRLGGDTSDVGRSSRFDQGYQSL